MVENCEGNCGGCKRCVRDQHPAGKGLPRLIHDDCLPDGTELRFVPDFGDSDFAQDVRNVAETNVRLLLSKHRDYGPLNISNSPGGALNGLRVRMHDKLARINHLIDSGADPEHESLIDSFIDLGNYALIAQLVIRGEWPKK